MSEVIRANLKPATIDRLGEYAKIRLGIGADDLINEALNTLEQRLDVLEGRRK
jgi:hypothetical protein